MALISRVAQWEPEVRKKAAELGVPVDLALSLIQQESGGKPDSVSGVGAKGLMQIMPIAVRDLGMDPASVNLLDPVQNIDIGLRYLSKLLGRFNGDERLAVAAYNAGPTRVARKGDVPEIQETQNYVKKIGDTLAGIRGTEPGQLAFRLLGTGSGRTELARQLSESAGLRAALDSGRPAQPGQSGVLAKSRGKRRGESA